MACEPCAIVQICLYKKKKVVIYFAADHRENAALGSCLCRLYANEADTAGGRENAPMRIPERCSTAYTASN